MRVLQIHPQNPQQRLIDVCAERLMQGALAVVPTDTSYSFVCTIKNTKQIEKIRLVRQLSARHPFTLMCHKLSEVSQFTHFDNSNYRIIKTLIPGAFTFILKASAKTPSKLHIKGKKTIGIRVPKHKIILEILENIQQPLVCSTLKIPGVDPLDQYAVQSAVEKHIDLYIDGGEPQNGSTTVIDLTEAPPVVVRRGVGNYD